MYIISKFGKTKKRKKKLQLHKQKKSTVTVDSDIDNDIVYIKKSSWLLFVCFLFENVWNHSFVVLLLLLLCP